MSKLFAAFALAALVISAYNAYAAWDQRVTRQESQQRQGLINQGAKVVKLNNRLINALAAKAAESNDREIADMLASEGVTFTVNTQVSPEFSKVSEPKGGMNNE